MAAACSCRTSIMRMPASWQAFSASIIGPPMRKKTCSTPCARSGWARTPLPVIQITPSVRRRACSGSSRPSSSPKTVRLCSPSRGAAVTGTCEPDIRTGQPGIVILPRRGWSTVTNMPRRRRSGSSDSSSVSKTAPAGTPAAPSSSIACRFVRDRVPRVRDAAVVDHGLLHRHLDPLADAGALALVERGQDPDGAVQAGACVADRGPRLERRPVQTAGEAQGAAGRLADGIEAGEPAEGPVRSVALDLRVDDPRVDLTQRVVAETQPLDGAGSQVLDEHVGFGDQSEDEALPLGMPQVQGDAAL